MDTLHDFQKKHGAKFSKFFPLIASFGRPGLEYQAAKQGCAIFDMAGLNILHITGKDCADLLHRMTMNEIRKMRTNDIVVNGLTNAKGRLVDAFFQVKRSDGFFLITSHNQGKSVAEWLDRYVFVEDVKCEDVTNQFAVFLLTGEKSKTIGQAQDFRLQKISLGESESAAIGGLLPKGLLILSPAGSAVPVYQHLVEVKKCIPAGADIFHALRVEQGIPIYGNEFSSEDSNPYEAGLKDFISYTKGCFIGQEVIARLDTYDKVKYEYARLTLACPLLPTVPATILAGESEAGIVTSSAQNFHDQAHSFALARIRKKMLQENQSFTVISDGERIRAKVITSTLSD
jgi:folate-binding protein YgfZ